MLKVAFSVLRANLMFYLKKAEEGEEITITRKGHILARISPPVEREQCARKKLKELQSKCHLGDVVAPISVEWESNL